MRVTLVVAATLIVAAISYAQVPGTSSCLPGVTPAPPTFPLITTVGVVSDYELFCTNTGFTGGPVASLDISYFLNVSDLNTGSWTLAQGANTYTGTLILNNVINFTGVAYDTNLPTLIFDVHGEEVNPSLQGPGFTFLETVSVSGSGAPSLPLNTVEAVGFNAGAPEPSTMTLAATALAAVLVSRRRRLSKPWRIPQRSEEI